MVQSFAGGVGRANKTDVATLDCYLDLVARRGSSVFSALNK